jgi:acyl-CoA carboxylase subunit beta
VSRRLDARSLRDLVLDPGSWRSWDTPVPPRAVDDDYARELARAAAKTQQDEAVVTGEGTLRGRRVAVVAGEFGFLAGSIGIATAERLMVAVERATAEGLPLLASPVSGGTRMQEGTVAFLQMIGITAAIARHKEAGLPYLVYLRGPTFGGVLASWGSLGHVTIAEPGAAVGFLGPRVYEALYGEPFPEGVQTSENLASHGLIDGVVPVEEIADVADRALRVLAARETWHRGAAVEGPVDGDGTDADDPEDGRTAWDVVTASRRSDRPGVRQLLRAAATDVVPLSGTGAGEKDPGLLLALARFGGAPCVVLGQDRSLQSMSAPLGPGALREARRGMRLAAELRLPLVTLIDTPGAALSVAAEEGGLAGEIAPWSCSGRRPSPSCWVRARAVARWRWCRPTGCWLRRTAGWVRCRRRAPRRSCTAPSTGPMRWPRRRACGPPTCGGPASSTGWCPSGPTPPTSRWSSASGSAGCWPRSWPGCSGATTWSDSAAAPAAGATSATPVAETRRPPRGCRASERARAESR